MCLCVRMQRHMIAGVWGGQKATVDLLDLELKDTQLSALNWTPILCKNNKNSYSLSHLSVLISEYLKINEFLMSWLDTCI